MKSWTQWKVIHRQVVIAGRILNDENKPVAGTQVTITAKAGKFKRQIENASGEESTIWKNLNKRPDRTRSRLDGLYFFLDLPEGEYTVTATDSRSGQSIKSRISILKNKEKPREITQVNLKMLI